MRNRSIFARRIQSLFLILTILNAGFSAFAQTKKSASSQVAANQPKQAAQKCNGAWTGSITYTRTQTMTDNKTVPRVSGRGEDTRKWEMKYDYKAQVAVTESPERNGSSLGKAQITHNFISTENNTAKEKNSCDRGKTWQEMSGTFTSETKTNGNQKVEANVNVGMNTDGTYTVSVGLPPISGETTGKQTSTFSGQCTAKEGKTLTLPATPTQIDGNSLTSDGTNRIDPSNPNKLSGSYSKTWQNVTETITWNLQRCGGALQITDLTFAQMKFPNWDDWQEIVEQTGTVDGNWVKIKAKVLNTSGETKFAEVYLKETYKGDKWDGAKPDQPLKDQSFSIRLEPGEEREVEMLWDSSGYAWFDDGRPRLVQRIKAEVWENYKKADEMTKNLKVAPKPVVLVHGLWSNWKAWETWQNILTTTHSYDWKAFPVGEKPDKGLMNTGGEFLSTQPTNSIAQNAEQLARYIRYAQEDRNAWHVDIVAHSMGGLISRQYINSLMPANYADGRPQVAHLIMLGTPNEGSPCADVMNFAFEMTGKKVEAMRQLKPDVVADFNRTVTNRKGVKFSALAGNPLPTMCKSVVWNDGVVPVASAQWQVSDTALSSSLHTDLTSTKDFSAFVKPRLAVGPRGDHNPDATQLPKTSGSLNNKFSNPFVLASFQNTPMLNLTDDAKPAFAKEINLAANQTVDVEIPVAAAVNLGITLMANPNVSATLLDEKGTIIGKNLSGSPESKSFFRSIFYDKAVTGGTWKLRLENTGNSDSTAVVASWSIENKPAKPTAVAMAFSKNSFL